MTRATTGTAALLDSYLTRRMPELLPTPLGETIALPSGGEALFTTKALGNLSLAAGVGHRQGRRRRDRLCESLSLTWLCAGPQVHGTTITRVERAVSRGGEPVRTPADGYVTGLSRVGIMVLVADCLPVVLGLKGAVAVAHAGWRGLAGGVLERAVNALVETASSRGEGRAMFGVETAAARDGELAAVCGEGRPARPCPRARGAHTESSEEIVAVLGPCAGACCYEVGEDVLRCFDGEGASWRPDGSGSWTLDLHAIAKQRLRAVGVDHVIELERCTICDSSMFSHRREGALSGRQAAIAWLP